MSKYGGYQGKILKIDLSTRNISDYEITDSERELYLGGKILAAKIIYDNIKRKIDAFDPENLLVITTGPLNGLLAPCSSRFNISGISPLTGLLTSSNCGGTFGMKLKSAGYDGLIITGKSKERIYIEINDDKVEFKNADSLWGKECMATQEELQNMQANPKLKTGKIVIGPAGENLVRYACILSDERAAGRGGLGAVMGAKNLKAITVQGTHKIEVKEKEKYQALIKKWIEYLRKHPLTGKQLPRLGTAGLIAPMQAKNILSTKNFSSGRFDKFESVSGEVLAEKYLVKNSGCISCPIHCARVVNVNGKNVKGPELETLGLLGPNILNDNLEAILRWNYLLDELGMDTISFAGTLSFAMELNEKGMWDNGLEFGKIDKIDELIHDVAYRNGEVAYYIGEGSRIVSKKFGGSEFAGNVKGMELAAYEPRAAVGQGLGYAVSNRGGCHLNGGYNVILEGLGLSANQYTPKGKASFTMMFQDLMEAVSAGGNCLFTTYAIFPPSLIEKPNSKLTRFINKAIPHLGGAVALANRFPGILSLNLPTLFPHPLAISYATGMKLNFGKLKRIGERGYNLERIINLTLGMTCEDDSLPKRLTDERQQPDNKRSKVPLKKLKKTYYRVRGWDKLGRPTKSLIRRLRLPKDSAAQIYGAKAN